MYRAEQVAIQGKEAEGCFVSWRYGQSLPVMPSAAFGSRISMSRSPSNSRAGRTSRASRDVFPRQLHGPLPFAADAAHPPLPEGRGFLRSLAGFCEVSSVGSWAERLNALLVSHEASLPA